MGDGTELFRREALHAQTKHLIGEVVLYRPLSFTLLTLVSLVFAAAIIAFLALASYTRKEEKMVFDPNLLSACLNRLRKLSPQRTTTGVVPSRGSSSLGYLKKFNLDPGLRRDDRLKVVP